MKRQVFYSFHFKKDCHRVQQIKNIGAIEGQEIVSSNEWEEVKRKGDTAIKKWIDDAMSYRSCVIVLIGEETASRDWVNYEIKKAANEKKAIFGIYIHNIKNLNGEKSLKGRNPFDNFKYGDKSLSTYVKCYDPNSYDAYNDIRDNLESWVEDACNNKPW